jgi:fermentation-respiration switch protein FrsA (DUF1100 family)
VSYRPPRLARIIARLVASTVLVAVPAILPAQQPTDARFLGTWEGAFHTGTGVLHLGLTVTRDVAGALAGEMVSVDQNNARFPVVLTIHGDTLLARNVALGLLLTQAVNTAGDALHGTLEQAGAALPFDMARVHAMSEPVAHARPQTPQPPFPYHDQSVVVQSVDGVTLAGTLTIPDGAGPFPAVVFVTGSGPQDRNETLLGHKPFLVIADHLARHGIASLRYDDRGVAQSTGSFKSATSADFANDAEAAVHFLMRQPGIDARHVGIIGHSEGGLIGPMVAARSHDVAFVVMLAGTGIPGDSILALQGRLIAEANGMSPEDAAQAAALNARLFAAIGASHDSADAAVRARAVVRSATDTLPVERRAAVTKTFESSLPALLSPWMRMFLAYDPRPALRRVTVPVLAMNGTHDLQVPYRENLPAIEAALEAGGNRDYRIVPMPGLNHLFQTAPTGNPSEYEALTETFAPAALDLLTTWITTHTRR